MMGKRSIMVVWLLGMALALWAQDPVVTLDEKGRAGYSDADGRVVLPCKFDAAYPFVDGRGKVLKGKKFGLVDATGEFIVPAKYDDIVYDRSIHLYRVRNKGLYGLMDRGGRVVLDIAYSYISPFNCYGKALLAKGGVVATSSQDKKSYFNNAQYGIVNSDGSVAVEAVHRGLYEFDYQQSVYTFKEGKMLRYVRHDFGDTLGTDCKYLGYNGNGNSKAYAGVLDEHGRVLMPMNTAQWIMEPHSGMVRWYLEKSSYGYYNLETGRNLILSKWKGTLENTKYWTHGDFTGSIAPIRLNSEWCFVDKDGQTVKSGYHSIKAGTLSQLWAAQINDTTPWEVFDCNGKPVFQDADYLDYFFARNNEGADGNYIGVKKGSKWGLINKQGETILPFEYEKVNDVCFGWVAVKNDGLWGYVDLRNNVIVPLKFKDTTVPDKLNETVIYVKMDDDLWHVYNVGMGKVVGRGYKTSGYFIQGVAWVKPADLVVPDDELNRSLVGAVNQVMFDKAKSQFALAVDEQGRELLPTPMPTRYMNQVRAKLKEIGYRPLTLTEVKSLKLRLTEATRHYTMGTKIDASNWDY